MPRRRNSLKSRKSKLGPLAGFWAFQTWFPQKNNSSSKEDKSTQVSNNEIDEELGIFKKADLESRRASFKSAAIAVFFAQTGGNFTKSRRDINASLSPATKKRLNEVYENSDLPDRTILDSVKRRTEKLVRNTSSIVDDYLKK